jgi:hypothetical protein
MGADRSLEVVDEGVHRLVRRSPVEVSVLVTYEPSNSLRF